MKNVHLICNAHIDPMWLWRWDEGCASALSTFRTVVKLLDEYPEMVFNHNEALLYDWIRVYDQELFEKIQDYVDKGRWKIMGGWYLQPECNMVTGESTIRNILTGRKFFTEYFHQRPNIAVNFDSFGHSRGMVQILTKSGFQAYIVCRPDKTLYPFEEQDFIWKGIDGSQIMVHRSDENYNSVFGHAAEELEGFLKEKEAEPVTLFLWGVGDHGGGPSRKDLENLRNYAEKVKETYHICHSDPESYYCELKEKQQVFPIVERGLNPVSEGCYTSQSRVKKKHRELENELYLTEKMLSQAEILYGLEYPKEKMEEAQKALLFSEFHDALPGSATQLVEEDTLRVIDHGLEIVAHEKLKAFFTLTSKEAPAKAGESTVLIYNPHPFDISGPIAVETELPYQNWDDTFMYPQVQIDGEDIPTQAEMEESNFRIDWRKKICVNTTLKASSVTRLDIRFQALPGPDRPPYPEITKLPYVFKNERMKIVINPETGLLDEYWVDGVQLLQKGSFSLAVRSDIYNSWGLKDNAHEPGKVFTLMSEEGGSRFSGVYEAKIPSCRIIEDGPVRTVVEAVEAYGDSKAVIRYLLPKQGTQFEVEVSVWWLEKDSYLKMELNLPDNVMENYFGQIVFGREELVRNHEAVSQKWLAVSGKEDMLAVLNGGSHGSSLNGNVLGLTLLRSAGYSCSDCNGKLAMREKRFINRMDQGERHFRFKFLGGKKDQLSCTVDQEALAFNEKPAALSYNPGGTGEKQKRVIRIDAANVILSCFKRAEDENGWILRVYEAEGKETSANLVLLEGKVEKKVLFKPFEVKTFRYDAGCLEECEMLEGY